MDDKGYDVHPEEERLDPKRKEGDDFDDPGPFGYNTTSRVICSTRDALIMKNRICEACPYSCKVSIVGARKVGMACAIAILMRRFASEVCLVDQNNDKAAAEAEDIQHASVFLGCPKVTGTSDIVGVKDSAVVVIAVCERKYGQKVDVGSNFGVFKNIIPTIAKLAPKAVLLVVTRPIDIMSYIAWKLSNFPLTRVIGTGTLLDTSRFQYLLSQKMGVARTSIGCLNIGLQSLSVPVWSSVHVAGTRICDVNPNLGKRNDPEKWCEISAAVNKIEDELNKKKGEKGPCCWALGFCTAKIVEAILRNTKEVLPVSTHINFCYQKKLQNMFISIPCVIGWQGVQATMRQQLNDREKDAMKKCSNTIQAILRQYKVFQEQEQQEQQEQQEVQSIKQEVQSIKQEE